MVSGGGTRIAASLPWGGVSPGLYNNTHPQYEVGGPIEDETHDVDTILGFAPF